MTATTSSVDGKACMSFTMITSSPYLNEPTGYGPEPPRKQRKLNVVLTKMTDKNVGQLRKLFLATFPVKYTEQLYKQIIQFHEFSRFAYGGEFLVAAVCARLEIHPTIPGANRCYIMTISVLSAWRRAGVASHLLKWLIAEVQKNKDIWHIASIDLHVQVGNDSALEFYKHNGFEVTGIHENYYKTLEEKNAHVLSMTL